MNERRWIERTVNVNGDHIVLNYGDDPKPIAWLARNGDEFIVQFNSFGIPQAAREAVVLDLDAVLGGDGDGDAWRDAIKRCGVDTNGDPPVHWGYYPTEPVCPDNGEEPN